MLRHISEGVVARSDLLPPLQKNNYVRRSCHQKLSTKALHRLDKKEKSINHYSKRLSLLKGIVSGTSNFKKGGDLENEFVSRRTVGDRLLPVPHLHIKHYFYILKHNFLTVVLFNCTPPPPGPSSRRLGIQSLDQTFHP